MAGLPRAGRALFRWRSFTPVLLLAAAVPLLARSRGGHHPIWVAIGFALCLLGQALRAWVLGGVPDGTSGQNERLIATDLNIEGPYALTRNPLYLGNLLITLGLCAIAHDPILAALAAILFAAQYRAIIAAEEAFLREKFGARFDEYASRVPRFWPRLRAAAHPRPWSPARAFRKEHNPAAAWLALALLLLGWDARAEGRSLAPYAVALAAIAAAWLAVKAWKHSWHKGGFTADMKRRLRETAR
jgi:protein-S-isoprenylcysteine O-methyltransferase Ste14